MINRKSIILAATLFLISPALFAQNGFRFEFVAGASLNTLTPGVFSNWGDGWTVGGGTSYRFSPSIDLAFTVTYNRYPYQGDNLQLAFPAIEGLRWSVSGQASNVIEASFAARVSSSSSFINHYLSLRTGLYQLNIGDVTVSTWFDPNSQNVSRSTYAGTGISTIKGFAALGFGVFIPFDSSIRAMIESRFTQTFDGKEIFIPLLSTIQFDL